MLIPRPSISPAYSLGNYFWFPRLRGTGNSGSELYIRYPNGYTVPLGISREG